MLALFPYKVQIMMHLRAVKEESVAAWLALYQFTLKDLQFIHTMHKPPEKVAGLEACPASVIVKET